MKRAITAILAIVGMAMAYLKAYEVQPVKAVWSGKARPDIGISQTITCNFDSVVYCELFNAIGFNGEQLVHTPNHT